MEVQGVLFKLPYRLLGTQNLALTWLLWPRVGGWRGEGPAAPIMKLATEERGCYPHQPGQSCPGFRRGNVWKLEAERATRMLLWPRSGPELRDPKVQGPVGLVIGAA